MTQNKWKRLIINSKNQVTVWTITSPSKGKISNLTKYLRHFFHRIIQINAWLELITVIKATDCIYKFMDNNGRDQYDIIDIGVHRSQWSVPYPTMISLPSVASITHTSRPSDTSWCFNFKKYLLNVLDIFNTRCHPTYFIVQNMIRN